MDISKTQVIARHTKVPSAKMNKVIEIMARAARPYIDCEMISVQGMKNMSAQGKKFDKRTSFNASIIYFSCFYNNAQMFVTIQPTSARRQNKANRPLK